MTGGEDRLAPAHTQTTDDADGTASTAALKCAHETFTRWLGDHYDLVALDAVLATAAVKRLGGDPAWLMVISGSGNAKSETVISLAGAGAHVTSTITEAALLSGTAKKDRAADASGGLLRRIGGPGQPGILVIKDFTSVISMTRDARSSALAALREVYDGFWERNIGTDGGRTLTWSGRIVFIGAVTTAYDSAHGVIASMGDRFALVRMDSAASVGRLAAGEQALANVGSETEMRQELAAAVGSVFVGLDTGRAVLSRGDQISLLHIANLVTLARTAVEHDYKGDVTGAHAPEMPTRFAKMLGQIVRGGLAIGMTDERALDVAIRVAGDSIPPLRLLILDDLSRHPSAKTTEVHERVQRPRSTVDRELQALHVLELAEIHKMSAGPWTYTLSPKVEAAALKHVVGAAIRGGDHQ